MNQKLLLSFLLLNFFLLFRSKPSQSNNQWTVLEKTLERMQDALDELTDKHKKVKLLPEWDTMFKAQAKQDVYMYQNFFHNLGRPGIFVEFGARDGIDHSNSYFFEHALDWKGMMVEASDKDFAKLVVNRPNTLIAKGAVCPKKGTIKFLDHPIPGWEGPLDSYDPERLAEEERRTGGKLPIKLVTCHFLPDLLREAGFHHIDFMSVDIEGAEEPVIRTFPWDEFIVDTVMVEQLIRWDTATNEKKERIIKHLESFGYDHVDDIIFNDTMDMVFRRTQRADLLKWSSALAQGSFSTQTSLRKTGRLKKPKVQEVVKAKPVVQLEEEVPEKTTVKIELEEEEEEPVIVKKPIVPKKKESIKKVAQVSIDEDEIETVSKPIVPKKKPGAKAIPEWTEQEPGPIKDPLDEVFQVAPVEEQPISKPKPISTGRKSGRKKIRPIA